MLVRPRSFALFAALFAAACQPAATTDDPVDSGDTGAPAADEIATRDPFVRPANPLGGGDPMSCAVVDATRCQGSTAQVCAPYDVAGGTFPETVDALQLRAWHYDRWYDLHHSPDGQAASRDMNRGFGPGTPEAEWTDPDAFEAWDGFGDSAIWTGVAANAALQRWRATGTEADLQRFEDAVRAVLTHFEVTDVDGYLARAHYLIVPNGTERIPEHLVLTEDAADDPIRFTARDPSNAPDLPDDYTGAYGPEVTARVGWQGNPSIDQYTGPMTVLPAAWSLLDDADLKARIERQLVGYLHRLERIEIVNLQGNPELLEAATAALGGGQLDFGDDLDLDDLDTLVLYGLPSVTHANEATVSHAAPADFPREATLVLDASDDTFLLELTAFATRLQKGGSDAIDHMYVPSVRGGDAAHMMHLALMAFHMTGEARYRDFLVDELVGQIGTDKVVNTIASLVPPDWCRSFYGDHITIAPVWALLNLLAPGSLHDEIARALREEGWDGLAKDLDNAKFDLMIADHLDAEHAALATELQTEAKALLEALGGNGGVLDDPRRTYTITPDDLKAVLGDDLDVRCPTEAQRAQCEDGYDLLGISIPGESIGHACIGHPLECPLDTGECAWGLAPQALPVGFRPWEDFLWQRSPFKLGAVYGEEGRRSSPGLDLTESYWLARAQGVFDDTGLVLAWKDDGTCGGDTGDSGE